MGIPSVPRSRLAGFFELVGETSGVGEVGGGGRCVRRAASGRYSSPYTEPRRRGASMSEMIDQLSSATGSKPASRTSVATTSLPSASSPPRNIATGSPWRPSPTSAWNRDVYVLTDFTSRVVENRLALYSAADPPFGAPTKPPSAYGLVVSTRTLSPTVTAAATSSSELHGTETTTTLPCSAASTIDPGRAPTMSASAINSAWSRLKLRSTSWPRRLHCPARFPPIRPAPMIPIFTDVPSCHALGRALERPAHLAPLRPKLLDDLLVEVV